MGFHLLIKSQHNRLQFGELWDNYCFGIVHCI
jgi:hypothetical protein